MRKDLNPTVVQMPRSGIRVVLDAANKLPDVVYHLEIGQPDLPTPPHIVEAAVEAARQGYTGYTPNAGFPSLRQAFAARLNAERGLRVDPEQVVVTVGAMGAIFSALCATVAPGDEVLIPDPGYPNYLMPVNLLGARSVRYPLDARAGFAFRAAAIQERIGPRTKAIIINSPSNPTGTMIDRAELEAVVALVQRHGLYLISDEAYAHVCFGGTHLTPLSYAAGEHVIAVYSCSKTYSMTGWRVGFAVSAPEIATLLSKLQEAYVACAPSVSQKAAEAALRGPQDCVEAMAKTYWRRRDLALALCAEYGLAAVPPQGAFYLLIALPAPEGADSTAYALRLLAEKHVAVAPGRTFGPSGEGYIRIALCAPESAIREGLERIAAFQRQTSG
ncbi:MAG: aminotransferase class I/II-fold pyridoxal phosphate-dependent enzyme [Anaerolineae bacterium]|nr:aminotransferase class I/II-fold pyridoxal phosphate-dependent enzyme [Anaerolineae bacterium]